MNGTMTWCEYIRWLPQIPREGEFTDKLITFLYVSFLQALVQGRLVCSGLQGGPRQAAGSSCLSSDLLRLPETSDCCAQHQQEQRVCRFHYSLAPVFELARSINSDPKRDAFPSMVYRERMSRLMVPFADQHVEIPSMAAGNIALTVGLKQVKLHTSHNIFAFSFRKVTQGC